MELENFKEELLNAANRIANRIKRDAEKRVNENGLTAIGAAEIATDVNITPKGIGIDVIAADLKLGNEKINEIIAPTIYESGKIVNEELKKMFDGL